LMIPVSSSAWLISVFTDTFPWNNAAHCTVLVTSIKLHCSPLFSIVHQ
jgi:hypothetical protein